MSWLLAVMSDFAQRLSAVEAAILLGLAGVMVVALALPFLKLRQKRSYRARDDEFRRLQNM